MLQALFLGILSAGFSLVLELVFSIIFPGSEALFFAIPIIVIFSSFVEEAMKIAVIYKSFQEKIISRSLMTGLGFSLTEIILNIWRNQGESIFLWAFLGLIFIHSLTCLNTGYLISRKKIISLNFLLLIIIINFLLHLTYNFSILRFF